jgi:hypothetical protein
VPIQLSRAINTRVEPEPKATLNRLDAEQGKEPFSVQIHPARNLLTESSPRPMVPLLLPDPPTETSIMDAMEKVVDWSGTLFRNTLDLFTFYDPSLFHKRDYHRSPS